jgi:hypothetical protein
VETAKELLEWNEALPDNIQVRDVTPEDHATQIFAVVLDYGWAERIIAGDCYLQDALTIARALHESTGVSYREEPA